MLTVDELLSYLSDEIILEIYGSLNIDISARKYWENIVKRINEDVTQNFIIKPNVNNIFDSLNSLNLGKFKVLLMGKYPLNNNGLAYSCNNGEHITKPLQNIFKEIDNEYDEKMEIKNIRKGDLTTWTEQGVLLLNSLLTIGVKCYGTTSFHTNIGWEDFISDILTWLDNTFEFVPLVLGSNIMKIVDKYIVKNKRNIIYVGDPTTYNSNNTFYGSNCFKLCNEQLIKMNLLPIKWTF